MIRQQIKSIVCTSDELQEHVNSTIQSIYNYYGSNATIKDIKYLKLDTISTKISFDENKYIIMANIMYEYY